jgi:FAD/FMN-containing dehydrogenase
MGFLLDEADEGAVKTMPTLKRALDPNNTLNPGKTFEP